jgi:hypothetical protein
MSEYKVTHDDLRAFEELVNYSSSSGYTDLRYIHSLYPVDSQTGMPSLPEGYYWRVFKDLSYPKVGLYYREETVTEFKGMFYFATKKMSVKRKTIVRKIDDHMIDKTISDPVVAITDAATWVLRALPGRMWDKINPVDYTKYYGEYPPKNLLTAEED